MRSLNPPWWSGRNNQLLIKGNGEVVLRGALEPRALLCFLTGLCRSGRICLSVQLPAFFLKLSTALVVFYYARIKLLFYLHQEK